MPTVKSLINKLRARFPITHYVRDILVVASGNSAAQMLGIVAMPLLTRLYTPSDFAALTLLTQVVAGLAILQTLRFEYLVMLPAEEREAEALLRLTFRLGVLHVMWLTPLLAWLPTNWTWLSDQGLIAEWLWLAPITALSVSISLGLQQAVQRKENFRASAASEFAGRTAYVSCALIGALALPNITGLMLSPFANSSVKLAWLLGLNRGFIRPFLQSSVVSISKSIRRLALWTSASNLISLFSGLAPMVFIADQYGANALGQYGLVLSTLYLPSTLLGQAIGQVFYQRASRLHVDGSSFSNLLVKTTGHLVKIGVPLYCLVSLIAPIAYPWVFGADWASSGEMARWLCIAAFAGFLSTPLDRSSLIVGAWWYLSSWHFLRAVMTAACLILSSSQNLSLISCVILLALQNTLIYVIDWVASYLFAKKLPAYVQ